ncbi:5e86cbc4-19c4-489e-9f2c-e9742cb53693-CDS [Sclerotinia trifoliorum]|uniref:5e86cbc4-19c4-489e-9f2c-e9742cb53693-CDS n=1 Tax=Sclerotinia trifoliorum TaxID=28548 RepID=A0A8H2VNH4_9HELO|nr:5e86cbc4-19c4-489e-9f2c-e9742cb53693-CDS [Sclerotinia trifoliorum]
MPFTLQTVARTTLLTMTFSLINKSSLNSSKAGSTISRDTLYKLTAKLNPHTTLLQSYSKECLMSQIDITAPSWTEAATAALQPLDNEPSITFYGGIESPAANTPLTLVVKNEALVLISRFICVCTP